MMIDVKKTVTTVIKKLHEHVVEPEETSISLLKFARSLNRESLNHFKKIYIFLREHSGTEASDRMELAGTTNLLNEIFVHTFSRVPQAIHMRDFFSFLREIFFYYDRMDHVDHGIAEDILTVLRDMIRMNSRHDLQQVYHSPNNQTQIMHMTDSFYFSKVTRGVTLLNEVDLNFKDEIFISLLF